ncbi:helix-turn-helix domain-containing protein [Sphingopyxis indica]|uniref:AraC-type DNA-binding protein n=1 Tax=Sphingopyxis indica TaxID=436663 RepID=A0A239LIH7_9SPHN|nr:AraC family transcriptional regulator [Sphingopyxis indica]SNT29708.1 AraC-type DNA-binding protein [Sphingopyxis indica]
MNPTFAVKLNNRDAAIRATTPVPARAPNMRRPALPAGNPVRPMVQRQRFKLGPLDLDFRAFPRQRAVSLTSTDATVHVLLPITGTVVVVREDDTLTLGAGSALLLAAGSRAAAVCAAGSSALFLHIPRAAIQALASSRFGAARRLAAIDHRFDWSVEQMGVALPRASIAGDIGHSALDDRLLEKGALEGLVETLQADPAAELLFPVARSVQRAVEHIRADPKQSWTIHELAQIAGVTSGTLRRNFRTCLGVTVTQLIQQIRLEWVRTRLESPNESRSIGDIALAAGFGTPGMMSRAYQRHFGETPSQNRARAFRAMRE